MGNISDLETQLGKIESEVYDSIKECSQISQLENVFQQYLGKKGALSILLKGLSSLEASEKKTWGQKLNQVRQAISEAHDLKKNALEKEAIEQKLKSEYYDFLQPLNVHTGHLHPVTKMQMEVESIFSSMGFEIMDGPEVETDENNFGRLNFSADHPAREMQDTIWTKDGNLLRTHTSCVQVRSMQKLKPPFRIIAPGRVFRYEQTDASHENTFHQVEGMMVGKDISVANLIGIMKSFLSAIFETDIKVRLRPGYFPFVEPGFELDSSCLICNAKGCKACKFSGWIELLPCGLIHPEVLKAGGMDPAIWNGFAFGLGLDRLVMLRYNIEDIRHFLSGNLRFLNQF